MRSEPLTDVAALQHDWKRDEDLDGDVDTFALSYGFHNGPECRLCGASYCHHCEPECYRYICPAKEKEKTPTKES